MMKINFMTPLSVYRFAVEAIKLPVIIALSKYNYMDIEVNADCTEAEDGAINIYSFFNEGYLTEVGGLKGITVHLPHGVADKDYRTAEMMDKFDYCVSEGLYHTAKLYAQKLSGSKIFEGGFPKFATLDKAKERYDASFKRLDNSEIKVLYAPTHSGVEGNLCSLAHHKNGDVEELLQAKAFSVIKSSHPSNDRHHHCTLDCLVKADVVVSDCSSVIYEAWHLGKPVVFLDWMVKDYILQYYPTSAEANIYNSKIGRHADDIDEAKKLIRQAYDNGITAGEEFFLNQISNSELRANSPKIIAEWLVNTLGGKL